MTARSEPAPSHVSSSNASGVHPTLFLDQLVAGRLVAVVAVDGDDAVAHRLCASGLWAGALIERIGRGPFGDPLLFRVHGYRLALRRSEAARVTVRAIVEGDR